MQDFRRLSVWQKAHELVLAVYRATQNYPKQEVYGLTSQTRRSFVSIPANIAEGCGRGGDADFARFLQIGMGSASESEYHLLLAKDPGYLPQELHELLSAATKEVKRMLSALLSRVRS